MMNHVENHGSGLHRLIYVSRAASPENMASEIGAIVIKAAAKNRALAVTGALLAYDGWFVQVLEGSYDTLKPLFDRIAADPRHRDVRLKLVEPAASRLFSRWGMKEGRAPAEGVGFDIGSAEGKDLLPLLKLAALGPARRAA
jgi:hypothetical protein